jgi:hypothetical protein
MRQQQEQEQQHRLLRVLSPQLVLKPQGDINGKLEGCLSRRSRNWGEDRVEFEKWSLLLEVPEMETALKRTSCHTWPNLRNWNNVFDYRVKHKTR